jgi:hypothetical protein
MAASKVLSVPMEARALVIRYASGMQIGIGCIASRRTYASLSKMEQGSKPQDGRFTRQYFYTVDEHGQLFLSDAKVKNFITAYKDKTFLDFFTKRIRRNDTGSYSDQFPYISPCGKELVCRVSTLHLFGVAGELEHALSVLLVL